MGRIERVGKVRLVVDIEVHLDGFEEDPKDEDFDADVQSISDDATAFTSYGEVLSVQTEILKRPLKVEEVKLLEGWRAAASAHAEAERMFELRDPEEWVAEHKFILATVPGSWQFDLDLKSLAPDGAHAERWCVNYRGGIRVPLVRRNGFWTLGLCKEVEDEVRRSFPHRADEILPTIRYGHDHWSFMLHGMYVGIDITSSGEVLVHS